MRFAPAPLWFSTSAAGAAIARPVRASGSAPVPAATDLPFQDPAGRLAVLVDDENIRISAQRDLGGLHVDYAGLARCCTGAFASTHIHVFSTHELELGPSADDVRLVLHTKQVPGKNVDMEVAVWLARRLRDPAARRPTHLLLVTGDQDYLVLHALAEEAGLRSGFLSVGSRSQARAIRDVPHGLLGRDVLVRRGGAVVPFRAPGRGHW